MNKRSAKTSGAGVRSEVSDDAIEWGSSSPSSSKPRQSCLAVRAAGSSKSGLPWLQALNQNPQAAPREGLRLDDLVILSWPLAGPWRVNWRWPRLPRRPHGVRKPARPASVSSDTPQLEFNWTPRFLERAEQCRRTRPIHAAHRNEHTGSVQMIEFGSEILIGPNDGLLFPSLQATSREESSRYARSLCRSASASHRTCSG